MRNDTTGEEFRPLIVAIAYRMTGSRAEAEDIAQETLIRWLRTDRGRVRSARAFLTTIATRLSLNRLRDLRARREEYPGDWLPEPVDTGEADPDARLEEISFAFLALLERLTPLQRVVFVLRSAFGRRYAEIAAIVGRDETACRKTFSRARAAIRAGQPRRSVSGEEHRALLARFLAAVEAGNVEEVAALLAEDVVLRGDGGPYAPALKQPLKGQTAVARFVVASRALLPVHAALATEMLNGSPAAVIRKNGRAVLAILIEGAEGRIARVFALANPAKLNRPGRA